MRPFRCGTCDQLVYFENSACLHCGSALGYRPEVRELVTVALDGDQLVPRDGTTGPLSRCANAAVANCNWLVSAAPGDGGLELCPSCRLTTVRPSDDDLTAMAAFARAEAAKRRLIHQLTGLGLPIVDRAEDPEHGLAFELLSSRGRPVTTGHERGVITLDLSESDDAHRAFVRQQLGEAYRTVLGHLRHEIGHYYWPRLVVEAGTLDEFRRLFGDETVDYQQALANHYATIGAENHDRWSATPVSQYATMHPWEDWAETFAHYLHIQDGLETAAAFGLVVGEPARSVGATAWTTGDGPIEELSIGPMIGRWLGLTLALNGMSRSIGEGDHYPFVLSPTVIDKLDFVHQAVLAQG
ncbi:MAG: putative zinc-binding metallopeptidase [Actinomycetota bacterium]